MGLEGQQFIQMGWRGFRGLQLKSRNDNESGLGWMEQISVCDCNHELFVTRV
jgi:hydroxypyruvate isomerase